MKIEGNLNSSVYEEHEKVIKNNHPRLCKKCSTEIPRRIKMMDGTIIDGRHRVYCLECSPFGKRSMCGPDPKFYEKGQGKEHRNNLQVDRVCPTCNKIFNQKTRNNECSGCRNRKNRRNKKRKYVEYKGGKCQTCGYDKCIDALEFHHIDPTQKEFGIAMTDRKLEYTLKELDKCILLCCRCHRELHAEQR